MNNQTSTDRGKRLLFMKGIWDTIRAKSYKQSQSSPTDKRSAHLEKSLQNNNNAKLHTMPVPLENLRFSFEDLLKQNGGGVKNNHSQSNREKKNVTIKTGHSKPRTTMERITPKS